MTIRPNLKALIVEDNHVSRMLLRGLLRGHGVEVEGEAGSVEQAREALKRAQPDLVCLDVGLPDAPGTDLIQEVLAGYPAVKVVMVTAASRPEEVREALGRGAHGYIVKPYSAASLLSTLERLFGARAA